MIVERIRAEHAEGEAPRLPIVEVKEERVVGGERRLGGECLKTCAGLKRCVDGGRVLSEPPFDAQPRGPTQR